jgi:hypothetical protein
MASGLDQWVGKLEGLNEIGEALTEQLQAAENEVQQFVGGKQALQAAAEKVGALGAAVSEDLEQGKLSFSSELEASEYIKKTIIRAREIVLNLAEGAKSREIAASGKVSALGVSRGLVIRHCKAAKVRAEQLTQAIEEAKDLKNRSEGDLPEEPARRTSRGPGEHPGPSSLDLRRVQAIADKVVPDKKLPTKRPTKAKKTLKKS